MMPFMADKGVLDVGVLDQTGRAGGYLVIDESNSEVRHIGLKEFVDNFGPQTTAVEKPAPVIQSLDRLWDRMDDAAHDNADQMRDIAEDALRALQAAEVKITALEKWREEYQGKLNAEHVRVGRQYMERLEAQELRIVELETIVNTPIKLPRIIPADGDLPIAAMCNRARNEMRHIIEQILIGHGLTVQGEGS